MIEPLWLIIIAAITLTNFIVLSVASLVHIRNEHPNPEGFLPAKAGSRGAAASRY